MASRFESGSTAATADAVLKSKISGLVSAADFEAAQSAAKAAAAAAPRSSSSAAAVAGSSSVSASASGAPAAKRARTAAPALSFAADADDDADADAGGGGGGGGSSVALARVCKDPTAQTGFLPDAAREAAASALAASLRAEFSAAHEAARRERIEVTYSWWDGTGHRRSITIPKGATVGRFLEWVRADLAGEFPLLRGMHGDALLYVKEDIIMPASVTFLELIVARARGKSGPLFNFDVHDDVRVVNDARVEKDESHPGKVIERRWYEKNKHTFPASRWEQFSWAKAKGDEPYTIHGDEVVGSKAK